MVNLKRNSVSIARWLFDRLLIRLIKPTHNSVSHSKKTVIFVRTDAIGDFVLWTAMFEELESLFPRLQYERVLVGNSVWEDLAQSTGFFDSIFSINVRNFTKSLTHRLQTLRKLTRLGGDICIHPTYSRELRVADTAVLAIPAPVKIGSVGDLDNSTALERTLGNFSYTKLLRSEQRTRQKPLMELVRNAEFLSLLTQNIVKPRTPDLRSVAKKSNYRTPTEKYFVLFPGASIALKEWPLERFLEIAKRVQKQTGWLCVFAGSSQDGKRFEKVLQTVSGLNATSVFGQTTLTDLAKLIGSANLLVTNDTAAIHFGYACQVPSVCILGGGHFERFVPWRISDHAPASKGIAMHAMECFHCNWNCVYGKFQNAPVPCVDEVTVEQTWSQVLAVLNPT